MKQPRVGVGVILRRGDTVLLGRRRGTHGEQTWSFPGGHLEFGESILDCARRETGEDTGLEPLSFATGPYTNDVFTAEGLHYITLFVIGDCPLGEPRLLEPDRCEAWQWFEWDNLPSPLFLPIQNLLRQGFRLPAR